MELHPATRQQEDLAVARPHDRTHPAPPFEAGGIKVAERLSAEIPIEPTFERYLETKRDKMGHLVG